MKKLMSTPTHKAQLQLLATAMGLAFALFNAPSEAGPLPKCNSAECVIYDLSSQDVCTEVTNEAPTYDYRWAAGLSLKVGEAVKGGTIAAYKLRWSTGAWSDWYIPGVNDIDVKYNQNPNKMRRMWSYFYDHTHTYLICKKAPSAF